MYSLRILEASYLHTVQLFIETFIKVTHCIQITLWHSVRNNVATQAYDRFLVELGNWCNRCNTGQAYRNVTTHEPPGTLTVIIII